jgi:hypothetical protein
MSRRLLELRFTRCRRTGWERTLRQDSSRVENAGRSEVAGELAELVYEDLLRTAAQRPGP